MGWSDGCTSIRFSDGNPAISTGRLFDDRHMAGLGNRADYFAMRRNVGQFVPAQFRVGCDTDNPGPRAAQPRDQELRTIVEVDQKAIARTQSSPAQTCRESLNGLKKLRICPCSRRALERFPNQKRTLPVANRLGLDEAAHIDAVVRQ
jgi:hypothetical protein